ncbi:MAG: hypothetical protein HY343_01380, partial [Lentisphaerae bacterium]|nr:hypothetical protein [Lentisphaerota bacterium]
LRQNPNCPCDHRAYTQVIVPDKLGKLTMADILNASGLAGDAELNIEAEGYIYAERRACACDLLPPGRFLRIGRHEDTCPACRRPLYPSFHLHTAVTPRVLGERGMRTPLGRLAAGAVQCVIITSSTRGALVFERNAT